VLRCGIMTARENQLTEARGAFTAEESYKQTFHLGDRIEAEVDDCFKLAQVIFAPDDTGAMRTAASVGDGPLHVKFMKSEEAA
jgi:hypothetical protein